MRKARIRSAYLEKRRQMEINYDQFIAGLKLYDHASTPQEQLILEVTRLFGECETAAPPGISGRSQQLHPDVAADGALRARR